MGCEENTLGLLALLSQPRNQAQAVFPGHLDIAQKDVDFLPQEKGLSFCGAERAVSLLNMERAPIHAVQDPGGHVGLVIHH